MLDALPDLLERSSSGITLPEHVIATGIGSSSGTRMTLTEDGEAVGTVEILNSGNGWFVTDVMVCS